MEDLQYEYDAVNRMQSISRLLKNKDFKSIILEGFLKDDFIYLGLNFANTPKEKRDFLAEQLLARGIFKQYLDGIISEGISANETIAQYSQEVE